MCTLGGRPGLARQSGIDTRITAHARVIGRRAIEDADRLVASALGDERFDELLAPAAGQRPARGDVVSLHPRRERPRPV
jgi:hypothetical protein